MNAFVVEERLTKSTMHYEGMKASKKSGKGKIGQSALLYRPLLSVSVDYIYEQIGVTYCLGLN